MTSAMIRVLALMLPLLLAAMPLRAQEDAAAVQQLLSLNRDFRSAYEATRKQMEAGAEPVLIVGGSQLELYRRGMREWSADITPPLYTRYKVMAHIPFAVELILAPWLGRNEPGWLPALQSYRDKVAALRDRLGQLGFPAEQLPRQQAIADFSLRYMDTLLQTRRLDAADLRSFARGIAPDLLANADIAAVLQLDLMHAETSRLRARLGEADWAKLWILVPGPKSPRAGNLQYSYYSRLLRGTEDEKRLLYFEGMFDAQPSLNQLGRYITDRQAAELFFGDAYRLDRDLLADGAARHLNRLFPR
ncbi:hypothetical protein [Ferrovibrio sp.]|uniref:hypothetical protein n=1 Tax=Ferrovibrio sp. TaxID=1917215 RepID=UPI003D2BDBFD